MEESCVTLSRSDVKIIEEMKESVSYPMLRNKHRKRIIPAVFFPRGQKFRPSQSGARSARDVALGYTKEEQAVDPDSPPVNAWHEQCLSCWGGCRFDRRS